ncbi:MAG: hypothetical protein V3U95_04090 [Dehalococcoidia bacterium]|nr:hypothetical protein [Chloroflexota bacterium]MCZ6867763.1 hypothetical protein [Chloroflexota bacterium]
MRTLKLNFTIPEDVAEALRNRIQQRRRSAFVTAALVEKLKKLEEEELIEGYQARNVEDTDINKEWENLTLQRWDR